MRVTYAHNYDMILAQRLIREGTYPGQHLYGLRYAERRGAQIHVIPLSPWPGLRHLSQLLGWRFGDLGQEVRVLGIRGDSVVRFSGEVHGLAGLAALRSLGVSRVPLVVVLHQPVPPTPLLRRVLRGVDVAVCLSRAVQQQVIRDHGRSQRNTRHAMWGPDLEFSGYRDPTDAGFVISTGKTGRDLPTLLAALGIARVPARVYALGLPTAPSPPLTELVKPSGPEDHFAGLAHFPAQTVIADMARASVVVVPLASSTSLLGLSEIADALALGKPLVITRSPFIDVDIERIGCGRWVEPGDAHGLGHILAELMADEQLRRRMGQASRRFAETHCNEETFGRVVTDALEDALQSRSAGRGPARSTLT